MIYTCIYYIFACNLDSRCDLLFLAQYHVAIADEKKDWILKANVSSCLKVSVADCHGV